MNALKELEQKNMDWEHISAMKIRYFASDNDIIYRKGDNIDPIKMELGKIDYDCGCGGQELYGMILMDDDSWWERCEYDGSEWWEHRRKPTIEEVINLDICL